MRINGHQVLRWHGYFLVVLTTFLTIAAYAGALRGIGPYGGLRDNALTVVGFVQAYPLMGLLGAAMCISSKAPDPWRFSLLAIGAHCVPLLTLAIFWEEIVRSTIASAIPLSLAIHGCGITVEVLSLLFGYRSGLIAWRPHSDAQ